MSSFSITSISLGIALVVWLVFELINAPVKDADALLKASLEGKGSIQVFLMPEGGLAVYDVSAGETVYHYANGDYQTTSYVTPGHFGGEYIGDL